jgi:L-idonate 5-dehydrogenase
MRAVRIHARQDMRTEQIPSPEPDAGEVRLRVGYVGICGSDLHYYADGAAGIFTIREPLIPGHEVSGVIDLDPTGEFEAGTPVTVHPATWGTPQPDLTDEQRHLWPGGGYLGSASTWPHTPGGLAEQVVVRRDQVRRLPALLPVKRAARAISISPSMRRLRGHPSCAPTDSIGMRHL